MRSEYSTRQKREIHGFLQQHGLENFTPEEKEKITDVVWERLKDGSPHLSHIKVSINNALMQNFGNEKTKVIFGVIRPLIK